MTTTDIPAGARVPTDRVAKKTTARTQRAEDDELEVGLAYTEEDGTRLSVKLGEVKGSHDAALYAAAGYDFAGLMEALNERQGTDLLAAAVWFLRMVNDRPNVGTYASTLDEVGYETYMRMSDPREPDEGDVPKV